MNILKNLIKHLNEEELGYLQKDLYDGNISFLIKQRLNKIEKNKKEDIHVCPVCGILLDTANTKYTLIFGPSDFKKKASFCGKDCLGFFLSEHLQVKRC
ncbi:hypothetical protein JW930_06800 [Candidatus Woesearchaeota archaeon]|nr:hypothetical protein [Candidatus Woesearchaeota archaeon]